MKLLRFSILVLLALALVPYILNADEEAEPQPREFSEEEIAAADKVRLTLTPQDQALYNGLRYLLRPSYEEPLMAGRHLRPCALEPFESAGEGPLTMLEMLRLWAVLDAGMPITSAVDDSVQRLLDTPTPVSQKNLAPYIIPMGVCLAAWQREALGRRDELQAKAKAFFEKSLEQKDATDDRSSLIQGKFIQSAWFANQMWRGLGYRYALKLGIEIDDDDWKDDLRALCGAYVKDRGWTLNDNKVANATYDLHPNLMSMVALSMATTAPEDTLSSGAMRTIEKKTKYIPEVLARFEEDYDRDPHTGSRLTLIRTLDPSFAPERQTARVWRDDIMRRGVASNDPSGGVRVRHSMLVELGISQGVWNRNERNTAETALTCLAITGGFLRESEPPLLKHDLPDIGRTMYAFSVLHASQTRKGGGDLDSMTAIAIEDGCAWLAMVQEETGRFPGSYEAYPGSTALALLAMLHGGWDRDSEPIQRGLKWLLEEAVMSGRSTYDCACVLMFLQKYYEPEQKLARILWVENEEDFEKARRDVWKEIGEEHREFIQKMMDTIDAAHLDNDKGGWAYGNSRMQISGETHSDNSISQYAMLGTKAASLLGADVNVGHIEHEARRLVRQYWEDPAKDPIEFEFTEEDEKETSTETWDGKIRPGGWSYACGVQAGASLQLTAAGMSSLSIARDELKIRGKLRKSMRREIDLTLRGAETWVKLHYYSADVLGGPSNPLERQTSDGWGIYYNLYSVERGCEMAGVRKLGGELDWYTIGAEALIQAQNFEGSWGNTVNNPAFPSANKPQTVNTAMAILFLKRASLPVITEHRKREKERMEREERETEPRSPITPGPEDK